LSITPERAENDLITDVCSYIYDPLGYVLYAFPWGQPGELQFEDGPDEWQRDVLIDIGKGLLTPQQAIQLAVASGHGIGKSALVSWIVLWAMSTCEDTKGVVTANTETQLKTKTWAELSKWYRLCINRHWFTLTATALFAKDENHSKEWRIDQVPWSESHTESFAGLHNKGKRVLLLFDEGSAIPDTIWEVSEGALTDEATDLIWCAFGNPTRNTGRFKQCFDRFRHRWVTRQIDSRTSRHTNKDKIAEWVNDYGEDSDFVKVRVRGMFPSLSVKQFISTADVDAAFGRLLNQDQYVWAPKIITVDPAWEGDDELVIAMRQGLKYDILRTIPKNDNDLQIAALISDHEDMEKADAVFIDAGYGTGIYSAGKSLGRNWKLVWFGGTSGNKGCINKRAEMWLRMREWLKSGGSIPKDTVLYNDLIGPEIVPRDDGVFQLESKKDMKKRHIPSPGRADALALSFAYPVQPNARIKQSSKYESGGFSNWRKAKQAQTKKSSYQEVYA
jgi:hypothetical protein